MKNINAATVTYDTTSALTIPGASNPYIMNFNGAVPLGATASLEIKWTAVGDLDGRDYLTCGGSTLYTTSAITAPYPNTMTTDVSTCLRGYNLTSGNRLCTSSAFTGGCGGYYYGLAAGHSTMEYARLTVTYADGPPLVTAFSPSDNSTTANMKNDLVIYFDRPTFVGSGNIIIKKTSDNSTVETIDVTSAQVTGSGTPTITINPSEDLIKNTAYYVQVDATAFNDNNGNDYAGISNTTTWNFTTLNIALPTTQATNLTFSSVTSNSLTLGWTNGNGNGRMVFAKQDNTGTANPVEYTNYTANASFGSGDQIGSSGWYAIYAGTGTSVSVTNLSSETNYIFHVVEYNTTSGEKVYLTDSATNNPKIAFITTTVYDTTSSLTIPGASNPYSMNFNGGVPLGATASLEINWTTVGDLDGRDYFRCGGSTLYTTSAITAPYPNTMTTDVSTCLRGYNLTSGNRICTANAWNTNCGGYYYGSAGGHSTMEYARLSVTYAKGSPAVTSFSPVDNATTISATENLVIYFDRPTFVGSGNIIIKKTSDNSTVETIDVASAQVTGSGTSVITIDPSNALDGDTSYYVQIDNTAFNDNSENNYAGISNTTTWNFSTIDLTPPSVQSSEIVFSSVLVDRMTVDWTNGNGDGRIVFARQANSGTVTPVDNTNYTASATFGSGTQIGTSGWYAVYKGTGTSVTVTNLNPETEYIFQVFEYDLSGSNPLFLTDTASNNPNVQISDSLVEPAVQASNLIFSSVVYNSMTVGWTNGNGDGRIVFARQANSGTATPVDNTNYTASATFGSGTQIGTSGWYAVYKGTGTSVSVTGLTVGTDYIFQVFEYDSSGAYYDYNANISTDNPMSQSTAIVVEPTTQTSNITFSSVSNASMTIGWSNGNGDGRAVFIKQGNSGNASPVDDTNYTASSVFGNGTQIGTSGWYCVYKGTGTSVSISGLSGETDYIAQVFEYNANGASINFLTDVASNNPNYETTIETPDGEDFETGDFSANGWVFGGTATNYAWTVISADKNSGTYSAKAGAFNESSRTSSMEVTLNVQAGNISFYKKVSSESGFDYLRFYIDDVLQGSWSGSVAWSQNTYSVSSGEHTFKWIYSKDGSVNIGSDTAWVDDILFPVLSDTTAPTVSSITSNKANGAYKVGEVIDIDVTFSEAVTSTGNVTVTLETGNIDRTCTFSVTNSTSGTCDYTVQAGDASSDLNATISGTIADQSSNAMSDFTPATSLSTNKNIIIDTTVPEVAVANPVAGTYNSIQSVSLSSSGSSAIYYTLDGNDPTIGSTQYSSAISISSSSTLKALAIDVAGNESSIFSADYVINLDSGAPIISSIRAIPASDSASLTWITNEESSSQVEYGLVSAYGNETVEADTGTRVLSHSVSLSGLKSCARYYYRVKSSDNSNNQTVSAQQTFATSGCTTSSVSAGESSRIEVSGGTVNLSTNDGNVRVTAPENFYSERTAIQINKLNIASAPTAPSGKNLTRDNFFNLLAVSDSGTVVETFDQSITFTISYGSDTESSYVENTLGVYKYENGSWVDKNCVLDISANTLTCTLPSFSVYGLFGEEIADDSDEEEDIEVELEKIKYSSTQDSITIKWETNRRADSEIKYGKSKNNLKNREKDKKREKEHKIILENLEADTQYYFKIYSRRGDENKDASKIYKIKTLEASEQVIESNEIEEVFIHNYSGKTKADVCSYIVEEGDNLWKIAKKVYGDATAYSLIIEKNKDKYSKITDLKLNIGDELVFDCEENQVEKKKEEYIIDEVDDEKIEEKNFKWWNPLTWKD